MALKMRAEAGTSGLPPFGKYVGEVKGADLMDEQDNPFKEGWKQKQVRIAIEITEVLTVDFEDDEDTADEFIGEDAFAYANYSAINPDGEEYITFTPRSKFRKWCQSISGRRIEDGDEFNFDDECIGKTVMITVAPNTKDNPTVADLTGYRKKQTRKRRRQRQEPDEFEGEIVDDDDTDEDFD